MNKTKKALVFFLAFVLALSITSAGVLATTVNVGKTYYVAADGLDTNSGLKESEPMSLAKANTVLLFGGDKILFKRGDTFYGMFSANVNSTSNKNRVDVDAYGEGELPTFSLAKIVDKPWTDCKNGFYKIDLSNPENYTGVSDDWLVGSKGKVFYANVCFIEAQDGTIYGEVMPDAESCVKPYMMYSDDTSVYIKCDEDPHKALGKIIITLQIPSKTAMRAYKGMNFRNLRFKYCGEALYGGGGKETMFINIENCIFDKIGGADINSSEETFTRGGNAIQFYNYGSNIVVKNNIFRDVFDVGFTCQGGGSYESPAKWTNITVENNIFAFNTQAFEIWCSSDMAGAGVRNLNFTNNLCIGQGEGWTSFRGRSHAVADILAYQYAAPMWQMNQTGNTYFHLADHPTIYGLSVTSDDRYLSADKSKYNIVADNNYIYVKSETSTVYRTNTDKDMADFAGWQALGQDKNSTMFTTGGKTEEYSNMYKVAATSDDFNEIVKAAKSAGVKTNIIYDKVSEKETADNDDSKQDAAKENEEFPIIYVVIAAAIVLIVIVVVIIILNSKKENKGNEKN
ncbi:MAG: hypothetical protein E7561_03740 [Ruminococcaceae bacterium]|nr:hypothetical protein [Oscillospiraceae bacterium]